MRLKMNMQKSSTRCVIKRRVFSFFLIFVAYFCLSAALPQPLNLIDLPSESVFLKSLQGQLVEVRGFWYPLSSDQGILTSQPNLKSCCLRKADKLNQQLLVQGQVDFITTQKAVTLAGIFKIKPLYDPHGQLVQLYVLEQAHELKQTSSYFLTLILGCLLILLCIGGLYFKYGLRVTSNFKI